MKQLTEYIYEGLFDVEKNVTDTHETEKILFTDTNSDFWKYCKPVSSIGGRFLFLTPEELESCIDINKDVIKLSGVDISLDTTVKNPFTNKYSLICNSFYIGDRTGRGPHPDPINNGGGFKDITVSNQLTIDGMCEKLGGFKFNIDTTAGGRQVAGQYNSVIVWWADDLDYFDAEFNFINPKNSVLRLEHTQDFPDLKNVKSNTEIISIYNPSFFDCDGIKSKLDKFFGKGTVTAGGVTKTKSIRNIVAIVNNMRKYGALIPTEVIPEGKLSDLIDVRGFKNIDKIIMRNNNVRLTFVKSNNEMAIMRQARFIRMNNMKLFKDTPIDELVSMVKQCQTKDGWVVLFEPEQF